MTIHRMISPRPAGSPLRVLGGLCAGILLLLVPQHGALAQGRLDARYEATLAGIPVGKGAWTIDTSDEPFSAAAPGGPRSAFPRCAGCLTAAAVRSGRVDDAYDLFKQMLTLAGPTGLLSEG